MREGGRERKGERERYIYIYIYREREREIERERARARERERMRKRNAERASSHLVGREIRKGIDEGPRVRHGGVVMRPVPVV